MNKEIIIPEGYEARIEGNKVILERKESEDEKIRKGLIYHLKELREWKAGTMSPPIRVRQHYDAWIAYLEKQKEQKPAEWSEEDFELIVGELVQDVIANEKDSANYGDSKKPTAFFVRKYIDRLKFLQKRGNSPKSNTNSPHWKPVEWSEEDVKDNLDILLSAVDELDSVPYSGGHLKLSDEKKKELKIFIESLHPQPHWKPSKEQMNALWKLMHNAVFLSSWGELEKQIESLYSDLKKCL